MQIIDESDSLDSPKWEHLYTIGKEKWTPIFPDSPESNAMGGRGSEYIPDDKINPDKYSLRFNPPTDWRGIKYNNHWFGICHLIEKTHNHFTMQDTWQKGGGPYSVLRSKEFGRYRKAIEIGSWKGEAAHMFMSSGIFDELHIIEPHSGHEAANEIFNETWESVKQDFKTNMRQFKNVYHYQDFSYNISEQFIDNDFDFIYIDASHEYEDVKRDIQQYYSKLKHGCIMSGNDYYYENEGIHIGVKQAVDEIFGEENVMRFIDSSWFAVKPKLKYV